MKLRNIFLNLCFLMLAMLNTQSVFAQQTITAATLSGVVQDNNGAIVSGTTVTATQVDTNQTQTVNTDSNGRYRFPYLTAGKYEIKADKSGFAPSVKSLFVTIGQALEIDFELGIGSVNAQVDVTADTQIIETGRTQVSETIVPRDVENLPLNGRNFIDLALLVPGVSRTNLGTPQRFAETSAVQGSGISIAGQRNLNNGFVVDGSSANDDAADLAGTSYSQDVVREFQVITSGGIAEFGRASGGFINILTQSGTNTWRGRGYGFLRNDSLDARNPLATVKDELKQYQYGVSVGGPIIKNRTFLFTNFEQTKRDDVSIITISQANVATINARLDAIGFGGPRIETGNVPGGTDTTNYFLRIDHPLTSRNQFTATYSLYDLSAINSRTVGGLNSVSRGTNLANRDHTLNFNNVTTVSSRAINEFRFQYRRSNLDAPTNDPVGPAVNITNVASFGIATFSPLERDINLYQVSDSYSTTFGAHSLKVGGEFLLNRLNIRFPGAFEGVYSFTSLANFLSGNYFQYQQAFGRDSQFQSNPNLGIFVQDEWKARKDLTFNVGLRYDRQHLPDPIQTDNNNVAPRVGVSYAPGDRKTVFRASYGLYYERLPLRATSNALQRDGVNYFVAILSRTSPGAPVFPNRLTAAPSTLITKPSITRIDPNIENAYSQQANAQIERELPYNSSFSVGYIYNRTQHLIRSRNVNVPTCVAAVDPNLCRPDRNFGNISRSEGSGNSLYNGLVVSFNKRANRYAGLRVSYTLSKSIDDAGNFFFSSPQNNFDLNDDRGLSDNDQRHHLTISGTLNTPQATDDSLLHQVYGGFQLSYIYTYASSLPFNVLLGTDRNGDTNNNDRPIGVGRNTGRGFAFSSFDLRLSRRFKFSERFGLEVLAEGFNLFNSSNFTVPRNTFGSGVTPVANFGTPTAAFDPRQIQLGAKFSF